MDKKKKLYQRKGWFHKYKKSNIKSLEQPWTKYLFKRYPCVKGHPFGCLDRKNLDFSVYTCNNTGVLEFRERAMVIALDALEEEMRKSLARSR